MDFSLPALEQERVVLVLVLAILQKKMCNSIFINLYYVYVIEYIQSAINSDRQTNGAITSVPH